MAKVAMIEKQKRREKLVNKFANKRAELKAIVSDSSLPIEERFQAQLKLSQLPRNGAKSRLRNRCKVTGRPRGNYRKFKLCRNKFRELASEGIIPGVVKSSW